MGGKHSSTCKKNEEDFLDSIWSSSNVWTLQCTPGPHLMRIYLVRYSTSARYEKYSIIHLVRPIIHLVRIFALSTSWIN